MADETQPRDSAPVTEAVGKFDWSRFQLGELAPFDISDQPMYVLDPTAGQDGEPYLPLSDQEQRVLKELTLLCSRMDVASRRFEVEQSWEARLFERGYQHLLPRRGGGWALPGENSRWGVSSTIDSSALYATNIYGARRDIIVSALARGVPKVQFFPKDPESGPDVTAAEAANKYKDVWEKSNDLRNRMVEIAGYFYTDDRVLLYTRSVADAQRFGWDEDEEGNRTPAVREITSVFGKLEGKLPTAVQHQNEMQFIQLYNELDVSTARATFPWVGDKIMPGSCGIGEIELDKIARVNTKLALLGSYVTGDAMMRDTTFQYTWMRPCMFLDESARGVRESLLEKFPRGVLVVNAGTQFCYARNESMDDHCCVVHPMPGQGQNRRSLGSNNIPVQKRLNNWLDLMNSYFVSTVPAKFYDAEVFDVDAISATKNQPGATHPFQRVPGVSVDQLAWVEPTPQPQPAMPDFIKWFTEGLPDMLDGAMPSLFGAPTNTDTVGGIAIQRDQALQRMGMAWGAMKAAISTAAWQAAQAASKNRNGAIADTLPGKGAVEIEAGALKGDILCYPEYDENFPETWAQREQRFMELVSSAATNPFAQQLLAQPANARVAKDAIRMSELEIPGADSVEKQQAEFETLLESGPVPNPQLAEMQQKLEEIEQGMAADVMAGKPVPPEAPQMIAQLRQAMQSMPPEISTVEVADDASEDHAAEAATCFEWMNGQEGRKFRAGSPEQRMAFANVKLHWQQHSQMAAKLAAQNVQPIPPKISISVPVDKMPGPEAVAALQKAGIAANPQDFSAQAEMVPHEVIQESEQPTIYGGKVKQRTAIKRLGDRV